MPALARGDERRILRFLAEAESFGGEHPFAGEFLTQLARLVPADWIGFVHGAGPKPYSCFERPGDEQLYGEVDWSQLPPVCEESPHFVHLEQRVGTVKLSDFLTHRKLHGTELYNLLLAPISIEDSIALRLPVALMAEFVFDRAADFDERDRAVLDALSPHLTRLFRAHETRVRLRVAIALLCQRNGGLYGALSPLTGREREVLELAAEGRTNGEIAERLWISVGTVRKHLDNIYAKLGVHTRTAAAAAFFRR